MISGMSPTPLFDALLRLLGLLLIVRVLAELCIWAWSNVIARKRSFAAFRGNWAVVTGASAGIGAGFARRLAARGVNLILIARSNERLAPVATECRAAGVRVELIEFDFSSATRSDYDKLAAALAGYKPTILINNVGVSYPYPTDFIDIDADFADKLVKVNIESTNYMTRVLLPDMIKAKRGVIYCLSSGGGAVTPAPLLSVYAGTKAYNDAFAVSLSGEVRESGVLVHSLTPFFVESGMAKMRASFTVPTSDTFAEKALCALGGAPRLNPYIPHAIMGLVATSLPLRFQVDYVANLHRNIRKRALRRAERLAKNM